MRRNRKTAIIYTILWCFVLVVAISFTVAMAYNMTHKVESESWFKFWRIYIMTLFIVSIPITALFIIGGFIDLMKLFKMLQEERPNVHDDGFVQHDVKDRN